MADVADDPLLPEQYPFPQASITGIGRIQSPGLWGDDGGFGAYSQNMPGGVWSTIGKAIADPIKKFYKGPQEGYPVEPVEKKDLPPAGNEDLFRKKVVNPADSVVEQPMGSNDLPPLPDNSINVAKPDTPDVWKTGTGPAVQYGGGGMAYAPGSPRSAPSNDDPDARPMPTAGGDAAPPPAKKDNTQDIFGNSLLGRMFSGLSNWRDQHRMELMALAGGLAGSQNWGTGLGRGFTAAASAVPQQNALNNQNATMQALVNRGYSLDEARAAAGNPTIMQQIAPMAFGAKNWQLADIGYNQYGQAVKGWVNNVTREVKGLDGSPMGPNGTGSTGLAGVSNGAPTPEMNLHGEDFLKTMDPSRADLIRQIGQGRGAYPSGMMLKTPYGQMLQQQVTQAYPDINAQTFPARQKAWNDWYGGGKHADAMGAITQAAVHGDDLTGTLDALGNVPGGRAVNAPLNAIGDTFGIGKSGENFGPAGMNIHALADELSKIWKTGTNSDAEVRAWEEKFPINGTLDQQRAAMRKAVELYQGGIDKLERLRHDEFGPVADSLPPVVDPKSAARIQHLSDWSNNRIPPPQAQQAPQQPPAIPPPQQRQVGQVYPTPKGPMRWMQDGWHPVQ